MVAGAMTCPAPPSGCTCAHPRRVAHPTPAVELGTAAKPTTVCDQDQSPAAAGADLLGGPGRRPRHEQHVTGYGDADRTADALAERLG